MLVGVKSVVVLAVVALIQCGFTAYIMVKQVELQESLLELKSNPEVIQKKIEKGLNQKQKGDVEILKKGGLYTWVSKLFICVLCVLAVTMFIINERAS